MNGGEKGAMIGGSVLFIIIMIICCYCCCCRARPSNQGIVMQPAAIGVGPTVMATSTRSTVPMQPFVNEA